MKLELKHKCPAASFTGLWVALFCFALLLCVCLFCSNCAGTKQLPTPYLPLKTEETPRQDQASAPASANPAAADSTTLPLPATLPASSRAQDAADEATDTFTLRTPGSSKSRQVRREQTAKFAKSDALDGQIGGTSTWLGTPGLPLTFNDGSDEPMTVYALKKPLMLGYVKGQSNEPITITKNMDGHGKELGIEVGWTLVAIGFKDITNLNNAEAEKLLHDKVGALPGAIPMKWKTSTGEIETVYAYNKPLGLSYHKSLPIKITQGKDGHGKLIGIQIGWELLEINYKDVTKIASLEEVVKMLETEVNELPQEP